MVFSLYLFFSVWCDYQLQAKLSRVQQVISIDTGAASDSRDSSQGAGSDSDSDDDDDAAAVDKAKQQVGPKSHMSLLDQHSKLKLEALGQQSQHFSQQLVFNAFLSS